MRFSQMFSPTLRETPAEAEVISHKLLVRAGFIRKSSAGIYTYLPLGHRVLQKLEALVRQEMNRAGGQEILMPILQPAELWLESGRWQVYGGELMRLKDRHDRDFCLGPTHEEIITALVRDELNSWRQLPILLYQMQNKYRDERRPRFGLMRGREFIMKDLYSFDRDEAGLEKSYQAMFNAYSRFFKRCGLDFRPVEADNGAIGGSQSHEFMVLAESGEAEIIYCSHCDYATNGEIAASLKPQQRHDQEGTLELVHTPGAATIADVAKFLGWEESRLVKTLFYKADGELICILLRGDHSLNEIKLKNVIGCIELEMADDESIIALTGCQPGYLSPLGLAGKVKVYADEEVAMMTNTVAGANQKDYHYINVKPGRDFVMDVIGDFRQVLAGDACPKCGQPLKSARGIEAGQVFKLGTKYSKALNLTYSDEKGESQYVVMGCYGIGVSRTMAAAVEQNYDKDGIIWPMAIAPFHVVVVPTMAEGPVYEAALTLYQNLLQEGVEVVLDDRDERAGVKFKDADLIGYPIRVTVGKKWQESELLEIKQRSKGAVELLDMKAGLDRIKEIIREGLKDLADS
jgi:prolyl-tRNA synthetase